MSNDFINKFKEDLALAWQICDLMPEQSDSLRAFVFLKMSAKLYGNVGIFDESDFIQVAKLAWNKK